MINTKKFVGLVSNRYRISELPSNTEEMVVTIDGYEIDTLENQNHQRPVLYRIEVPRKGRKRSVDNLLKKINSKNAFLRSLTVEVEAIATPKGKAVIYPCFGESENFNCYKIKSLRYSTQEEKAQLHLRISTIKNAIQQAQKNQNKANSTLNKRAIDSASFDFYVEPIGQGNMASLNEPKGEAKVLFDAGHGIPINKHAITTNNYKFNDQLSNVKIVFLSHWDEDHFQLANHPKFSFLKTKFWYVPFSLKSIYSNCIIETLKYEARLLVWETLLDITRNQQFFIIEHLKKNTVNIGTNLSVTYESGKETANSNNKGVVFVLNHKFGKKVQKILIPGDAQYCNFPFSCSTKFNAIIGSHHGSATIKKESIPLPADIKSKYILSFGFNSRYKHPSKKTIKNARDIGFNVQSTSLENWFYPKKLISSSGKLTLFNKHAARIKVL